MEQHSKALKILVYKLEDFSEAERFCELHSKVIPNVKPQLIDLFVCQQRPLNETCKLSNMLVVTLLHTSTSVLLHAITSAFLLASTCANFHAFTSAHIHPYVLSCVHIDVAPQSSLQFL